MDPRKFLDLSKELEKGNRPCEFRTAISRAYYAAYHVSLYLVVKRMKFSINQYGGHAEVRRHLGWSDNLNVASIGRLLGELESARIKADYYLNNHEVENKLTVQINITRATTIISTLDDFSATDIRRFKPAIKAKRDSIPGYGP